MAKPPFVYLLLLSLLLTITSATIDDGLLFTPPTPPHSSLSTTTTTSSLSPTSLYEPILSHLGFHELSLAVPSLTDSPSFTTWNGPSTLFAPSDSSLRSCTTCSTPRILSEHIVPGLFSFPYLRTLTFGTRLETMNAGRCLTITSAINKKTNATSVFINGVEITHPDMFNNGLVVVHGLDGFVSPLSPFSCSVDRMTTLSFPLPPLSAGVPSPVMRLMIRDAMLRLRSSGFGILALAMKIKYPELVNLQNMTVFAIDDASIFTGAHSYVSNIRFHIVPNHFLETLDLEKLPVGTVLPTLDRGQFLVVTTSGGPALMRINYVRIKIPEIMKNLKIIVHSLFLPFPHIHPASLAGLVNTDHTEISSVDAANQTSSTAAMRICAALEEHGGCGLIRPSMGVQQANGMQ